MPCQPVYAAALLVVERRQFGRLVVVPCQPVYAAALLVVERRQFGRLVVVPCQPVYAAALLEAASAVAVVQTRLANVVARLGLSLFVAGIYSVDAVFPLRIERVAVAVQTGFFVFPAVMQLAGVVFRYQLVSVAAALLLECDIVAVAAFLSVVAYYFYARSGCSRCSYNHSEGHYHSHNYVCHNNYSSIQADGNCYAAQY